MRLYHGTTSKRTKEIEKHGICTPDACKLPRVWGTPGIICRRDGVYITNSPSMAEHYAEQACQRHGGEPTIWEITDTLSECKLVPDPHFYVEGKWVGGHFEDDEREYGQSYIVLGCDCIRANRVRGRKR